MLTTTVCCTCALLDIETGGFNKLLPHNSVVHAIAHPSFHHTCG